MKLLIDNGFSLALDTVARGHHPMWQKRDTLSRCRPVGWFFVAGLMLSGGILSDLSVSQPRPSGGLSVAPAAVALENVPPVAVALAYPCQDCPPGVLGDCDCDGWVTADDFPAFLLAAWDVTGWTYGYKREVPGCYRHNADLDVGRADGVIDLRDYAAFQGAVR
jgi:hypothetical protein